MKTLIFTLIIGGICAAGGGFAGMQAKKLQQANYLPTQTDIQTRLVEAGYDLEIDGVIGKKSREAWDDYTMKVIYAQDSNTSTK